MSDSSHISHHLSFSGYPYYSLLCTSILSCEHHKHRTVLRLYLTVLDLIKPPLNSSSPPLCSPSAISTTP